MGRYYFRPVPFGITSAQEIFQRNMTELLYGLNGIEVIIDDILVYGKTHEEHDNRLDALFEKIHLSGLKLNGDKCEFRSQRLSTLDTSSALRAYDLTVTVLGRLEN
jgi:hypothetical protein